MLKNYTWILCYIYEKSERTVLTIKLDGEWSEDRLLLQCVIERR